MQVGRGTRRLAAATLAVVLAGWGGGSSGTADAMPAACPVVTVVPCAEPPASTTTTAAPAPEPAAAPTTTTTVAVPPSEHDAAARLLELLNAERAHAGLGPLAARPDVGAIAARWSAELADRGSLAHNDAYFTAATRRHLGARALGENVARAADADRAHRALMDSPGHRANILDARFTVIGVGAVLRDGSWWFTQSFVQPIAVAAPAPSAESERPRAAPNASVPDEAPAPTRAIVPADTATAVTPEVDPPAVRADLVLDRRAAPTDPSRRRGAGTSPWTALAAVLLAVPLVVLVGPQAVAVLQPAHGRSAA